MKEAVTLHILKTPLLLLCTALALPVLAAPTAPSAKQSTAPSKEQPDVQAMLETIDERSRTFGDYKATVLADVKRNTGHSVRKLTLHRRDSEDKLLLLITAPRVEAGKGYLVEGSNLWFYDTAIGRWHRRTLREYLAGTDGRADDFDRTHWSTRYKGTYAGTDAVGESKAHVVRLDAKEGADVPYRRVKLWIDQSTGNTLKRQDFADSGRLLRTALYPEWRRVPSSSMGGKDFWYAKYAIMYDELRKDHSSRFLIKDVETTPLPQNVFTKAWLESRSR